MDHWMDGQKESVFHHNYDIQLHNVYQLLWFNLIYLGQVLMYKEHNSENSKIVKCFISCSYVNPVVKCLHVVFYAFPSSVSFQTRFILWGNSHCMWEPFSMFSSAYKDILYDRLLSMCFDFYCHVLQVLLQVLLSSYCYRWRFNHYRNECQFYSTLTIHHLPPTPRKPTSLTM